MIVTKCHKPKSTMDLLTMGAAVRIEPHQTVQEVYNAHGRRFPNQREFATALYFSARRHVANLGAEPLDFRAIDPHPPRNTLYEFWSVGSKSWEDVADLRVRDVLSDSVFA